MTLWIFGVEERIDVTTKPARDVMGWLSTSSQSKLTLVVVHALLVNDWISTAVVLLTSPNMTRNCAAHHDLDRSSVCPLLRHPHPRHHHRCHHHLSPILAIIKSHPRHHDHIHYLSHTTTTTAPTPRVSSSHAEVSTRPVTCCLSAHSNAPVRHQHHRWCDC